jgi:hypothetical protein
MYGGNKGRPDTLVLFPDIVGVTYIRGAALLLKIGTALALLKSQRSGSCTGRPGPHSVLYPGTGTLTSYSLPTVRC